MKIRKSSDFLRALELGPYAWPGGYPHYFLMADNGVLSFEAAKAEHKRIIEAMLEAPGSAAGQWVPAALEINWEDEDLVCDHTNELIPCAYPSDPANDGNPGDAHD